MQQYLGNISISGATLQLQYDGSFYPKSWTIVSTDTLNKDGKELTVYRIETSRDGHEEHSYSTRHYQCSIYQDGNQVYINSHNISDEE